MDGYPVHNYGTDPLGRLGMHMIESSLDWDERQKILERQAQTEVLKSNREMLGEQAKTGTLAPGFETTAGQLGLAPNVVQGMGQQSQQAKFQTYLKELGQTADLSKKKQDYLSAEINKYTASLEYWQKKKTEAMEAGTSVVPFNDNLDMIGKKLTELTGQQFDPVRMTDISEIKKYKEQIAIGEVSKLESQLTQAMAGDDPRAVAAASSALSSQIMTSAKQLGMPKDTFASANDTLKQANESLKTMLAERVKPKPTYETKLLPDGTRIQVEAGTGKENLVQGRPPVTDDIAFKKKAQYVAQVMKIPEADAVQMVLQGKQQSKQQFVATAVQAQVALGMKPAEVQKTITEMGKIYDMINGTIPTPGSQLGKPGTGKKDFKYLWEK